MRTESTPPSSTDSLPGQVRFSGGWVDLDRCQVHRADGTLALTHREVAVLRYFLRNPGRAIARAELLQEVWDYASTVRSRATDNAMVRLRNKVEAQPEAPVNIMSVRGVGYRFEWSPQDEPEVAAEPPAALALVQTLPQDPDLGLRGVELDALRSRVNAASVLVLHGPPGVGKSHLAGRLAGIWQTPAWRVDLDGVRDPEGLAEALAGALGLRSVGPVGPEHIGRSLQGQSRPLVVLDNADGLNAEAEASVLALSQQAPDASFLLTVRQMPGAVLSERMALGPLSAEGARALFEHVARRWVPEFTVQHEEAAHLDALLARLDRLPLAIELAAARIRLMALSELHRRLEASPSLATASMAPALRDAFDGSWGDLDESDRRSLQLLCAFEGSFSLVDAEAVLDPGADSVTVVSRLLDAALVLRVDDRRKASFRVLNTVREWVRSQRAPDVAAAASARHLKWCGALARRCADAIERTGQLDPELSLSERLPDFVEALRCGGEPVEAAPLVLDLLRAEALSASPRLCVERLTHLLDAGVEGQLRNRLLLARAEVHAVLREAMQAQRDLDAAYVDLDETLQARAARTTAVVFEHQGSGAAAFDVLEQALERCVEQGDWLNAAHCQMELSRLGFQQTNPEPAQVGFMEALKWARRAGERRLEGRILGYLGITAQCRRSYAEAYRYFQRSLAGARRVEDVRGVIIQTINLGNLLTYLEVPDDEVDTIESDLRDNLELAVQMGRLDYQCASVSTLMDLLIRQERAAEACELVDRLPGDWMQIQPTISSLLWTNIAAARHLAGEYALAERAYVSAADAFAASGQTSHVWRLKVFHALYLAEVEAWDEALDALDAATDVAEPPPCVRWLADVRTAVLACRVACETTRSPDQGGVDTLLSDARAAIAVVEAAKPLKRLPIPIESTRSWVVRLLGRALP